jgi:hypothetical protein
MESREEKKEAEQKHQRNREAIQVNAPLKPEPPMNVPETQPSDDSS